jgi:endonuclease/exonuclease/phosphatase family metal-dependent hydrolase
LSPVEQASYNRISELKALFARYAAVAGASETGGADFARWFTHFSNRMPEPDRTIDYIFLPPLSELGDHHVRQKDLGQGDFLKVSNHFPVVLKVTLPQ